MKILKAICTKPLTIIRGTYYNIFHKHQDLAIKRLKICAGCSHAIYLPRARQSVCDLCGCVLESKARIDEEKCEMNKW